MFIYKITNLVNGKIYIGQTVRSISRRWIEHCSYRDSNKKSHIDNAIKKHGKHSFKVEEIGGANSLSELNYQEWILIHKNNSMSPNGYNLKEGGNNPSLYLRKMYKSNPDLIVKMSKTTENLWKNKEYRKKILKAREYLKTDIKNRTRASIAGGGKLFEAYEILESEGDSCNFKLIKVKLLGVWQVQSLCAEELGIDTRAISNCLSNKTRKRNRVGKYTFRFCDDVGIFDKINNKEPRRLDREFNVYKITDNGKSYLSKYYRIIKETYVGSWSNRQQCAKDLGLLRSNICLCLSGVNRFHKGHTFKYK